MIFSGRFKQQMQSQDIIPMEEAPYCEAPYCEAP